MYNAANKYTLGRGSTSSEEVLEGHLLDDIRVGNHLSKLGKVQLAIAVLVGLHDRLVDDLLQLLILEVVPHHHLEHEEQLAVGDVPVSVHVVYLEGKFEFLFPSSSSAERAEFAQMVSNTDVIKQMSLENLF